MYSRYDPYFDPILEKIVLTSKGEGTFSLAKKNCYKPLSYKY
jgi:hypothetical protein